MWADIVDKVYVVSLPKSKDRRAYVSEHLNSVGIANFEWHDAIDPNHPEVEEIFASGKVDQYPPCFRCGKLSCGKEDCNNFLVPAQVAVFATYLRLWRKIAASPQTALVVEDDVQFHDNWPEVLAALRARIDAGTLVFEPHTPRLLRLGWAKCAEHDEPGPVQLTESVRMSNPCHALTSAFARQALDKFERVYHTADVFLHRDVPNPGEAFSVLPPMASELSWSEGAFDSLIHPKPIRASFLRSQGDVDGAKRASAKVMAHNSHIYHRSFLVVGHPRTGTGFTAEIMRQLGLDIGHEADGKDGVSSWMMAVDDPQNPWAAHPIASSRSRLHWDFLVQPTRDIATAVPSIMRENSYAPASLEFRQRHIQRLLDIDISDPELSEFERAIVSLTSWSRIIQRTSPDLQYRIESDVPRLMDFLARRNFPISATLDAVDVSPVNSNKLYKGKTYPKPDIAPADWHALPDWIWAEVRWYCQTYGYDLPVERN